MECRIREIRNKEVVNICDGCRLGFVSDVKVELPCGQIVAIVVPGPCKLFGLVGRQEDYLIPWECIRKIGPDIVLVDIKPDQCKVPKPKLGLPF